MVTRSFIGTICLMTVPLHTRSQHVGLLISYYITFSFWSAQTLALSLISRNIAGQTKKAVAISVNFIIWSTGNAVGEFVPPPPPKLLYIHPTITISHNESFCEPPRLTTYQY